MFKRLIQLSSNYRRPNSSDGTLQASKLHRVSKRPRHEHLEDRRMLATLTVNVSDDFANNIDDGQLTLREAIAAVSGTYDPQEADGDKIQIDESEDTLGTNDQIIIPSGIGNTIALAAGQMNIMRSVTITGPGRDLLTIDADSDGDGIGNSRIFEIDGLQGDIEVQEVELEGLTQAA